MRSILDDIKNYSNKFFKNWLRYLLLFLGLDLFNEIIIIPLFRLSTTYTLQAGAIPFISYQNVVTILTKHSLIGVALLIECIFLVLIIYLQFEFLILAIQNISAKFITILKMTWQATKRLRISSVLLLLAYFLLIIPFVDIVFRTPLLAKIQIPEFILDYMTRNLFLLIGLLVIYAIILVLGIRLLLSLPLLAFNKYSVWQAMKRSWNLTAKKKWLPIISRLLFVTIFSIIILMLFYGILLVEQYGGDKIGGIFAKVLVNLNLYLVQVTSILVLAWSTVINVLIILKPLNLKQSIVASKSKISVLYVIGAVIFIFASGETLINNSFYLNREKSSKPLIISHRGVSNKNGVQNTVSALRKTVKLHPDYVEIDLHETKDNQFVVMHDENLKQLANINKTPKELTLKQLKAISIKENGHRTKVASFDEYLAEAHKLHQKLLIEIKTTQNDSKSMLNYFDKKYGDLIKSREYQVQSLDYSVIEKLHKIDPKLFVLYIQPYNLTYPHNLADGYSMEYSTLNNDFIWQAHLQNKPVYAWTVDNSNIMKKMMYEGVDGIITNDVIKLENSIKYFEDTQSFTNRLLNYIIVLPNPYSLE